MGVVKFPMDNKALAVDGGYVWKAIRLRAPSHLRKTHVRVQPIAEGVTGHPIDFPLTDEGKLWCHGWEGLAADALKAVQGLS